MGKCSKCGKNIEYNNFVVVDGIVYHKECAPKKEVDLEVVKAELEAKEQFEKDMAEIGEEAEKIPECDNENIMITTKKPRKKRNQK